MLLSPILAQAARRPDAPALIEDDRRITFRQLADEAGRIAGCLQAVGVGRGDRVGILLDRGIDAALAIFGSLKAGACYVPVDPTGPATRRRTILADAGVVAVIARGAAGPADADGAHRIDLDEPLQATALGAIETNDDDPAAILYTSGSTGRPKGVVLQHRAIAAFADWAADRLALGPEDRIASSAPFFCDLSTFDLYSVLGRGGCLEFVPSGLFVAPAALAAWLRERSITGWYTVPSLLAFLAYKGRLAEQGLPHLRFLIFAGEVFQPAPLRKLATALPDTALFNFYGPTETNVCCHWPVARDRLDGTTPIPIGGPAAGAQLRINPASGELQVRGPTLAAGYWERGTVASLVDAEGWYATGDQVSVGNDGEFHFLGRLGRMLKCAGHRVEPAEIEAALREIDGVIDCAVTGIADPAAGQRPAALLVVESGLPAGAVQGQLRERLPAYMLPSRYRIVASLPRLPNGKLDHRGVQALFEASQ